jgi:FixJ family two-component response regulator
MDPLLKKILLGGRPSEEELRRFVNSRIVHGNNSKSIMDLLDISERSLGLVKNEPRDILKALIARKVASVINRKVFNH